MTWEVKESMVNNGSFIRKSVSGFENIHLILIEILCAI